MASPALLTNFQPFGFTFPAPLPQGHLSSTLGLHQKNAVADVRLVQQMINQMVDQCYLVPMAHLPETGQFDVQTREAVRFVEFRYFGLASFDGVIRPGDSMEGLLLDLTSGPGKKNLEVRLSTVMYQLAEQMVPGGAGKKGTDNISTFFPSILQELVSRNIADMSMILYSLATIRAENDAFTPAPETANASNTTPGGHPFDKYDYVNGNHGESDANAYLGRGFIQLTGRENYRNTGRSVALDLENDPDLASKTGNAAKIFAQFIKDREPRIRAALQRDDLAAARAVVNGGCNGLAHFTISFNRGQQFLHLHLSRQIGACVAKKHARKRK